MIELSSERIVEAAGASVAAKGRDGRPERAAIDSREVRPGDLFVGLSGERASRNYGEVIHRKWQEISHKAPRARLKRRTPKY